jgi:hypothetical protein
MTGEKKFRRHPREIFSGLVKVTWIDACGQFRSVQARGIDISQSGIGLELPEPVEPRTMVHIEGRPYRLLGTANVRHCQRNGIKFMVGLEFSGELEYRRRAPSMTFPVPGAVERTTGRAG